MEEQTLFLLEGYYEGYKQTKTEQSKIVGLLEPSTGVFKGIEILSSDCNTKDYDDLCHYIYKCYQTPETVSLVVGYYNRKVLQYQILLKEQHIGFGHFEQTENKTRLLGRERMFEQHGLVRNLKRPVNHYDVMIVTKECMSIQGKTGYFMQLMRNFSNLYDVVEAILLKRNDDRVWKGLQTAIENMAPKLSFKTHMLIPSKYDITR